MSSEPAALVDPPWEPPLSGTELEHLAGALDRLRYTFRWKAGGLDAAGLSARIGASTLTLGALLKHLTMVESLKFTWDLEGGDPGAPWNSMPDHEWPFSSAAQDSPDDLYAGYDAAVGRSRERLAAALQRDQDLGQRIRMGAPEHTVSLRRLLYDLVEEYGRHTGHADLLREAVD